MSLLRRAAASLVLICALAAGPAAAGTPDGFIRALADSTLPDLTDPMLPLEERKARFRAVMQRDFDLTKIAKLVLGRHWRRTKPEQRAEFAKLLEDYIAGLYARHFEDLAGLRIAVEGVRDFQDSWIVYTRASRSNGSPVLLDWRVDRKDDGYAIIDLVIEGISMIVTQREQFSSIVLESGGVDGLLLRLRDRLGSLP